MNPVGKTFWRVFVGKAEIRMRTRFAVVYIPGVVSCIPRGYSEGIIMVVFFFSSRRRHTRSLCDWSSDVCSSDLPLRMLLTPGLDNPGCLLERGAHRSAAFPIWVEPEWKFHGLIHHSAGAIIRFLDSLFDAQRLRSEERRVGKEWSSRSAPEK